MSTIELKKEIKAKISHLKDDKLLSEINEILNEKSNKPIYILSDFQKERVLYGREEYKKGKLISNEEVDKETDEWLNSK